MQMIQNIPDQEETANTIISLEELIKNHATSTNKLKAELKQAREMYNDSFKNNPTYVEVDARAKEVIKSRSAVKNQILKQPDVAILAQKVKDLRFDLREQQKTLSDILCDYKEQTGATQLELFDGQLEDIVLEAKLVKRSSF